LTPGLRALLPDPATLTADIDCMGLAPTLVAMLRYEAAHSIRHLTAVLGQLSGGPASLSQPVARTLLAQQVPPVHDRTWFPYFPLLTPCRQEWVCAPVPAGALTLWAHRTRERATLIQRWSLFPPDA
jgi:hypothetical protein